MKYRVDRRGVFAQSPIGRHFQISGSFDTSTLLYSSQLNWLSEVYNDAVVRSPGIWYLFFSRGKGVVWGWAENLAFVYGRSPNSHPLGPTVCLNSKSLDKQAACRPSLTF